MLVYRILCALLLAWATNWALSRPEAQPMLENLPDMKTFGPIAGAAVGYFNLAVRQGWGFIVAFANGIWAGVLSIVFAGVIAVIFTLIVAMRENLIQDFDAFLRVFGETVQPMLDELTNVPLLVVSFGASAIVGVVTEVIHWLLVRVRSKKNTGQNTPSTGP